ncbi:MAG: GNAT family N-acetyltransferase [Hyphomonas sp.]|uniref:GNAT family N-acetyltransferase n=1 Tax=Hyphomonas sp. TaxID=87 RepID=UPI00391C3C25
MSDYEIHTARLVLRRASEADPHALNKAVQDPRIFRNVGTIPPFQTLEDTIRQQRQRAARAAEGKGAGFCAYLDGELMGMAGGGENEATGIIDFGYWIAPHHWGQGYATEAARAVLHWFVAVQGRRQFTASYFLDNPASGRVLEKLGFRKVGTSLQASAGRETESGTADMIWPQDDAILTRLLEAPHG